MADLDPTRLRRLRAGNLVLAALHAAQAALVLALSNDFGLPVTWSWLDGPPGVTDPTQGSLFELPLGAAVAAFLLLAAVDHLLVGTAFRARYERDLGRGINVFRWLEYSISATIMVVLIAMLTGVSNVATLVALAGANVAMILFGWLMERVNDRARPVDWLPFWFGCIAGVVPWVVITLSIVASEVEAGGPPGFVYVIFATLLILFFSFAVNQWLQYRGVGRFRDYLVGEWGYLVLSLVAKSLLAWLVFANVLIDETAA